MKISKRRSDQIMTTLIILICCFFLGYLVTDLLITYFTWDIPWYFKILRTIEIAVILLVAYFIHIFLHETGHMVAALCRHWHFISFYAFRWVLSRKDGKWQISRMHIPGAAGQCMMMPPEEGDSLKGVLWYNAGGLIANAVLVVVAVIGLWAGPVDMNFELRMFWWTMIFSGAFVLLLNGVPIRRLALPNDGTNIKIMLKDPSEAQRLIQCLRYQGWMQQGKTLTEVATGYFFDLNKDQPRLSNSIHAAALTMDLALAMNKFDFDKADEILSYVRQKYHMLYPLYWKQFRLDIIYLHLVRGEECPPDILNEDMEAVIEKMAPVLPAASRAKYMIAKFRDKDLVEADAVYHQFKVLCDHWYLPGEAEIERRLVEFARLK